MLHAMQHDMQPRVTLTHATKTINMPDGPAEYRNLARTAHHYRDYLSDMREVWMYMMMHLV